MLLCYTEKPASMRLTCESVRWGGMASFGLLLAVLMGCRLEFPAEGGTASSEVSVSSPASNRLRLPPVKDKHGSKQPLVY